MAEKSFFYLNLLSVTCKHGDPINIQEFFSYFLDQILFLLIHEWTDGEIFFSTFCQLPFQQKKKKSKRKLVIFSFYGIYLISSARFLFLISFYIDFLFCLFVCLNFEQYWHFWGSGKWNYKELGICLRVSMEIRLKALKFELWCCDNIWIVLVEGYLLKGHLHNQLSMISHKIFLILR